MVNSDNRILGKISEVDLLNALIDGKDPQKTGAGEIMELCPALIHESASPEEAVHRMIQQHLIRIPMVDREGRLASSVTRQDLLRG